MIKPGLILALLFCLCNGEGCLDPVITPSTYTTNDAVISSESVFIVELSLACANGVQSVALYADVNGRQFPVTRGQDVGKFQVSWSLPHKQASSGTYQVKFFDEESYSALRKVGWHSLATQHMPCMHNVPLLQCEIMRMCVCVCVCVLCVCVCSRHRGIMRT
uniref:Translocon-associated protein subunit delta n=1 Tax=Astyanax mexicanus TaxID=7994 RepID=A0A3B1JNE7_ASTMX